MELHYGRQSGQAACMPEFARMTANKSSTEPHLLTCRVLRWKLYCRTLFLCVAGRL